MKLKNTSEYISGSDTGDQKYYESFLGIIANIKDKEGKADFPSAFVVSQEPQETIEESPKEPLDLLSHILPDLEKYRDTFEDTLDFEFLKSEALETTQKIREDLFLPFHIKNNRPLNDKEVKKVYEEMKKRLHKPYANMDEFVKNILGSLDSPKHIKYDTTFLYSSLFIISYYAALKTALHRHKVQNIITADHKQSTNSTSQKILHETLIPVNNHARGSQERSDISSDEFLDQMLTYLDPNNHRKGMLQDTQLNSRHKCLYSIVMKMMKSIKKRDEFISTYGVCTDDFGGQSRVYVDETHYSLAEIAEELEKREDLEVKINNRFDDTYVEENITTSQKVFDFLNLKIFHKDSTIGKLTPLIEIQLMPRKEVMYARLYREMLNKGIITIDKKKLGPLPEQKISFLTHLIAHTNTLQHYIYKIEDQRKVISKLLKDEDIEFTNTNYNAANKFLIKTFKDALHHIYTELSTHLENNITIKHITQYLGIPPDITFTFPSFSTHRKSEGIEIIHSVLSHEVSNKLSSRQKDKVLLALDLVLSELKHELRTIQTTEDNKYTLYDLLKHTSDPGRVNN